MNIRSAQKVVSLRPALPAFDLAAVIARVKKENSDWTPDRLKNAEQEYRQFVADAKQAPGKRKRPSTDDMDKVWHAHILFTKKYAEDCQAYLGRFLHHEPIVKQMKRVVGRRCCSCSAPNCCR